MIYNEDFETLPREVLETLQLRRLQQVLQRVYHTVGFYKKTFDKSGIRPDDIKSLADMGRIPFTTKKDLVDNYPFGLFAVPMSNIVRLHASSGTKGRATVVGYTKRDIETWSELMTRCFVAAGLTKNDVIHNAFGYGLFTGGLGVHYGAEKLGASVIPISGGNTKRQLMILQDFGPTAICCTPSYALNLAAQGRAMGAMMILKRDRDVERRRAASGRHVFQGAAPEAFRRRASARRRGEHRRAAASCRRAGTPC